MNQRSRIGAWFVVLGLVAPAQAGTPARPSSEIPAAIRSWLSAHDYHRPAGSTPCTAFRGQFVRSGQTDWAVIARRDSTVHLLVFPAGATRGVEEVQPLYDSTQVALAFEGRCTFEPAARRSVRDLLRYWAEAGEAQPEVGEISHEGIEEWMADCCSVIHYRAQGRWVSIDGMD